MLNSFKKIFGFLALIAMLTACSKDPDLIAPSENIEMGKKTETYRADDNGDSNVVPDAELLPSDDGLGSVDPATDDEEGISDDDDDESDDDSAGKRSAVNK